MGLYRCGGAKKITSGKEVSTESSYTVTEDGIYIISVLGIDYANSNHWTAPSITITCTGEQIMGATGPSGTGGYAHPYYSYGSMRVAVYRCKSGDKITCYASVGSYPRIYKLD